MAANTPTPPAVASVVSAYQPFDFAIPDTACRRPSVFGYLGREQTSKMFLQQVLGWKEKLVAIALMSSGIYCIAG